MARKTYKKTKLIFGVGVNDADYPVTITAGGKQTTCQFYQTWASMLRRCYSALYHERFPTYIGCTVVEDWHSFSNFKKWMECQDFEGKHLDKDFLFRGNKIYSADTCVFISGELNSFILNSTTQRGDCLVGVHYKNANGKYVARCCNPLTKKREHLGYFDNETEAHVVWKRRKHELAYQLADIQTDERVVVALRGMFA